MKDALGVPQSLLLLGGTSDIALGVVEEYARLGTPRVVVAARPSDRREAAVRRVGSLGLPVEVVDFDARDTQSHRRVLERAAEEGDVDVALIAFGVLGDEERA